MLLAAIVAAGALEGAVHRRVGGVEQFGDLRRLPADDVAQEQDRALARGKVLERGDEGEADGLAGFGELGGVALSREHTPVGHRQHPLGLGQRRTDRCVGGGWGRQVHRPGATVAPVQHVEAHVGGDAVQPRPERRSALEAVVAAPGAHHGLLHRILGFERGSEHAVAVRGELPPVLLEGRVQAGVRYLGHARSVPAGPDSGVLGQGHGGRTARRPGTHRCDQGDRPLHARRACHSAWSAAAASPVTGVATPLMIRAGTHE